MKSVRVKKQVLEEIALAARNTFPLEFIAMVGSKNKNDIIDEIVVIPAVFGKQHALIYSHLVPFDRRIAGSVHSHPGPTNFPSKEDIASFRKLGKIHFIVSAPFSLEDISAFDNSGKSVAIRVVE